MNQPDEIVIGQEYYVIHSDYNGTHILHATANWEKSNGIILFMGVESYLDVAHQGIEDTFNSYEEAYAELNRRNKQVQDTYIGELLTLEDLINFALTHEITGKHVTQDENARQAFIRASKQFI